MNALFIYNLKQPCENRGVKLEDPKDGTVILDGVVYRTMHEAEDFLLTKPRLD